jgi:hypothetical protein
MEQLHPAVSDFFRRIGRAGAQVRQLSQSDRTKGVRVRQVKAGLIRQGYSPGEALRRARIQVGRSP